MKLSPKIKIGCKSCNKNNVNNIDFDINAGAFGLSPIKQQHKVTTILPSKSVKTSNKVKSLF